jgi:hypothetical protein
LTDGTPETEEIIMLNKILYVVVAVSLVLNTVLVHFLITKGINISNTYHTEQHQHQNQQQSTVVFHDGRTKSNLIWKYVTYREIAVLVGMEVPETKYPSQHADYGKLLEAYYNTINPGEVHMAKELHYGILIAYENTQK